MVLDNVDDETIFSTCYDINDLNDQGLSLKAQRLLEYLPQGSHGSILVQRETSPTKMIVTS